MTMLVLDPIDQERILKERAAFGRDRLDEVWEGVYVMAPIPNNEHQDIDADLITVFRIAIAWTGLGRAYQVNVSDRDEGWTHNFRVPDVAVFLNGGVGRDCGTHWCGGPDFAVEIVSPADRSREKLDFYARNGVRELLVIDRDPWGLELYRLLNRELIPAGTSSLDAPYVLTSQVIPLSFRLVPGDPRLRIEVAHADGVQRWLV